MPTFLDRYLAGDRIGVWNELVALGEAVRRRKALLADAEAVAEETMRRARCNIELLISRLAGMGYRFAAPAIERELETIQKSIAEPKLNAYVLSQLQKAVAAGKMPPSVLNPTENPGFKLHLATLQKMTVALEAEIERMATKDPLENPRIFYFYPPEEQTAKTSRPRRKSLKGRCPSRSEAGTGMSVTFLSPVRTR